jgi:hypothetical protein
LMFIFVVNRAAYATKRECEHRVLRARDALVEQALLDLVAGFQRVPLAKRGVEGHDGGVGEQEPGLVLPYCYDSGSHAKQNNQRCHPDFLLDQYDGSCEPVEQETRVCEGARVRGARSS